jgi:hypothetical protein
MSRFTPGPWTCDEDDKQYVIGEGQSKYRTHVGTVYADDTDPKEAKANAHLIAAAPDMYEALQLVVGIRAHLRVSGVDFVDAGKAYDAAEAALAKAEGREP